MGASRLRISTTVCFQQSSVLKVTFSGLLQVVYRDWHPADYHHAFILDLAFHENLAIVNPVSMAATLRKTAPKAIEECHKFIQKQNPISAKWCFLQYFRCGNLVFKPATAPISTRKSAQQEYWNKLEKKHFVSPRYPKKFQYDIPKSSLN